MSAPIEIDPDFSLDTRPSGISHFLVLDPEARTASHWSRVGPLGMPEAVWHDREVMFALPDDGVVSKVVEVLRSASVQAAMATICDAYCGAVWDGHNDVGKWIDFEDGAIREGAERLIEEALAECPTYWDAADWLGGNPEGVLRDVREALRAGKALSAWAEDEAANAEREGNYVEANDVVEVVTRWLIEDEPDGYEPAHLRVEPFEDYELLSALRDEAAKAGDLEQLVLCDAALDGDAAAAVECRRIIEWTAAQNTAEVTP